MIDLILWANTRATLRTFAQNNNLLVQSEDSEGNITWVPRDGLEWDWWGGTGKLMRTPAVVDQDGNVTTPATYIPGEVLLMRIHGDFFNSDRIPDAADQEQWSRSKVARFIRNNGTPGTVQGVNYYELDGVRIFRAADVQAKLAEWGVPGHEWLGGNQF